MSEIKLNEKQLKESALINKIHTLQNFIGEFIVWQQQSNRNKDVSEFKLRIDAEGKDQYSGYCVSTTIDQKTVDDIMRVIIDRKEELLNELAIDRKEDLLDEIPYSVN